MPGGLELTPPIMSGVATYPAGATFGPRRMRDFEFVWVIAGDAEYRRDETVFPAPEGSVVLCRPGATDSFRWDTRRRTRHGYFHFGVLSLPPGLPPPDDWPLVRPPTEGDVLRPLFRHLLAWSDTGSPLLRGITMSHMLTAFVTGETAARDVPHEALPDPVEKALAHLHQRLLEEDAFANIGLGELAAAAHVSPEHLCRLFKAATGHSPVETVRLARLDRAAVLLTRSNYHVSEVSAACGFSSPAHFSRRFKQAFGRSPRDVRAGVRNGEPPPLPRLLRHTLAIR